MEHFAEYLFTTSKNSSLNQSSSKFKESNALNNDDATTDTENSEYLTVRPEYFYILVINY